MDTVKFPGKPEEKTVDVTSNMYPTPLSAVHATVDDEEEPP
jgi:hypothetical protein